MNTRSSTGSGGGSREKIPKFESTTGEEPSLYTNKSVLNSHLNLLIHARFSDVTFIVGEMNERILCHQLFLKARSPVFEVMFSERWNKDASMEVPLEDVGPETFKKFLLFIYTDTLEADVPQTLELLQLAYKYDVQQLVIECEELLERQLTLDHALDVLQHARMHESKGLMDIVGDLWARSLYHMRTHPSFNQLDKETLMFILKRNDLKLIEVDVFHLALQWARNQTDVTVEESLEDILPLIRFPTMTLNEFTKAVVPTKLLSPSTVIELFTYFGNDDEAKESLARTLEFGTQHRRPEDLTDYVKLYAQDNYSSPTRFKKFHSLNECMQFHVAHHIVPTPEDQLQGIGFSGITVYCPAQKDVNTDNGRASKSFKTFRISLKSKDCHGGNHDFSTYQNYKKLLNLSSVQVEEGTTADINFDTAVPLKTETTYCITIMDNARWTPDARGHYAKYFGPGPKKQVTVMVNNVSTSLAVRRNELQGFQSPSDKLPQLICRLAFQEL